MGSTESQPHWEKPGVPRQMPFTSCLLFWWAIYKISYSPENRVFKDKICLYAQHMPGSSKPRCSNQGDWQNFPKGGPLGTQAKVAPCGWASDPSLSLSTQAYAVTLTVIAACLALHLETLQGSRRAPPPLHHPRLPPVQGVC